MRLSLMHWSLATFTIVILSAGASEITVRSIGLVNFPTYDVDNKIGYIVKENQRGAFLNTYDWYFNDKSMPIQRQYDSSDHPNILLIGNSVIMGGNAFKQQEKLTPLLQEKFGKSPTVWPLAIGGWTQINEMVYLDRHPEIVNNTDYFAWEYMANQLSSATPWKGEYLFPTHRPLFATWYIFERYLLPKVLPSYRGNELPVTGEADPANIQALDSKVAGLVHATHRSHAGMIWFYPTAVQLIQAKKHREWMPEHEEILRIADKYHLKIVDIADYPEWTTDMYRDGVHPNVEGNKILANILYSEIEKDLR